MVPEAILEKLEPMASFSSMLHWFNRPKKDFEHARGPYVIPPTQLI